MAAKSKSNIISITRIYNAPVKTVWEAWTDPEKLAQWWGPRGFTITTYKKETKPGGIWHYMMHGPDGVNYENKTLYHEVEKYRLLVYDHGGNDERAPLFRVTAEFKEIDGKTELKMAMALPSPEAAEETRKFIKKANGNSTWDRLAEFIDANELKKERFYLHRTFDVSVERLFEVWTSREHMVKWVPPTGFNMRIIQGDVKEGQELFYSMSNDSGMTMYGKTKYLEIKSPAKVAHTQQFCDEKGQVSRHPMAPTWPEIMFAQITFISEGPNLTRVSIMWEPHGKFTAEELATFVAGRTGMTGGWTGSLDKLESYLDETH